ncbi:MAG: tyrosine-type recombinase/integrase [Sphingobacteriaceae bacterium]|nr:tyrosine-type recombinase/integrase [Sphingobacteriaceae bacterium]
MLVIVLWCGIVNNNLTLKVVHPSLSKRSITKELKMVNIWLREYTNTPNTFISYNKAAERFLMWLYSINKNLKLVTREVIQDYQLFMKDPQPRDIWCGVTRSRKHPEWKPFYKPLGSSSINLQIQILKSMYQYLVDYGYLVRNPFRLIRHKLITQNKVIEKYLNHKEWAYLIEYVEFLPPGANQKERYAHERLRWIFSLLYFTACRRNEVITATMADFTNKRGQWWLNVIGKGGKHGSIPITNELLAALIRYRTFMNLPKLPNITEMHIPLISKNNQFAPLTGSALYKIIKRTCHKLSNKLKSSDPTSAFVFKHVSTHWLRHTSATHQVDAGIDLLIVKSNLRHALLETTMKYQHTEANKQHHETITKFGQT